MSKDRKTAGMDTAGLGSGQTLRQRAEAALQIDAPQRTGHELRVHQIELELQNEELRRTQIDLEEAKDLYFDLYDLAPVGYCTLGASGLIQQANLTLATLLGVTRTALVGRPLSRFVARQDQDTYFRLLRRQRAGMVPAPAATSTLAVEPLSCELRLDRGNGTLLWVQLVATLGPAQTALSEQDEREAPVLRLTLTDINARWHADAARIESEERWKFAIEGVGDGLWDWNIQTGQSFYSRRYKEMLGFAEDDIGNTADEWSKRIHPDDAPAVMATLQPYLEGNKAGSATIEFRMLCKDGSWRWILGRGMAVSRDPLGRPLRMIGTNTDITERKEAQAVDAFLAQAHGSPEGESFFFALARFLAKSLQMDYICIDRLEGDQLNASTLAIWHDGHFESNLTYALRDTPCGEVVGKKVCCFPAGVCHAFPNDAALQDLQAESYVGVTLWGHTGKPIGLIAVIGRHELTNRTQAEITLERIAVRAAGELERLDAEAAMQESENRFRTVVEVMPDAIALHRAGKLVFVNPAAVEMFGAASERDLIDKPILELIHPDFHAMVRERIKNTVEHGQAAPMIEERYLKLDGSCFDVAVQGRPIVLDGRPAVLSTVRDITANKQAEAKLQLAASVFDHAREGIMITSLDGTIIDVNEAFTRITGYGREEALGQNPRILNSGRHDAQYFAAMWRGLAEQGFWYGEIWNRRKNGEIFAEMQTISAVQNAQGIVQHYVSLFSDITAIKAHQSQLERLAHFDALTNLPNRVLLADRLQQAMAQAQRRGQQLAVVYLDLDGFKTINDQHGHEAGDQVLITLAERLKQAMREGDTMARLGGDEFVAVLIDLENVSACLPLVARLLAGAAQPVQVGDLTLQVSGSLGVTFYPQAQDIDADQLLRQADQAMYQAKLAGKNRYHIFDAAQDSSIRGHHESLEHIRLALANHEFVLHYQPKVNMRTGQVIGAEALIRWQHPEKGLLAPAAFLPVIEDHPLAVAIGEWVTETALTQMEFWHAAGLHIPVSVNVGAHQLQQGDFVDRLRAILAAHPHVRPGWLELEVLETSALADMAQVSQVIEACAQFGVMFALDDFGTGYSSLTYLKRLRVTLLKIDRSFVRDMLDDSDDLAILEGVIGLAAAFKRQVIAEGVESVAHGTALLQLGCELAQGYGIARPMPPEQLPQWAASWQPDPAWARIRRVGTGV